MMAWVVIGESAFTARGQTPPRTPNEAYCFEVGAAQAVGSISTVTAAALVAPYTAGEQAYRILAARMFTNT